MLKHLANIITMLNLFAGILSLYFILTGNYIVSAVMIIAAVMLDYFDGLTARRLNIEGEMGKNLDSLCDMVSFGVSPACLVMALTYQGNVFFVIFTSALYIMGGAYRLARFNIMKLKGYFLGLPITIAGGLVALATFFVKSNIILNILLLLLAALMVSTIKIKKIGG